MARLAPLVGIFRQHKPLRSLWFDNASDDRVEHGEVLSASCAKVTVLVLAYCYNNNDTSSQPDPVDQYRRDMFKQNHGIRWGYNVNVAAGAMLFKRNGTSGLDQYSTNGGFVKQDVWQWMAVTYDSSAGSGYKVRMYSVDYGMGLLKEWSGGWSEQLETRSGFEDISGAPLIIANKHSPYDRGWPGMVSVVMVAPDVAYDIDTLQFMQSFYRKPLSIRVRLPEVEVLSYYGCGGVQYDLSGNNNHGTVYGGLVDYGPHEVIPGMVPGSVYLPTYAMAYISPGGFM